MYSNPTKYRHCQLTQPPKSPHLTIDPQSETVLLKVLDATGLDANLIEARESGGYIPSSYYPEIRSNLSQAPTLQNPNSLAKNLSQLEKDINQLQKFLQESTKSQQESLGQRFDRGMASLESQSEQINQLAERLAAEILKFQELADRVNQDYHAIQNAETRSSCPSDRLNRTPVANICEVRVSAIPTVVKEGDRFILTTKSMVEDDQDNPETRVKKAQQRQKALEYWLEAKRQRIIDDFSRP